ncbi:MAG TPA: hypothetical protein VGS19_09825 [Streptosporangiaceae bacterium]|nr:hypothetical protein [Streptosporangiaceae bacterium]
MATAQSSPRSQEQERRKIPAGKSLRRSRAVVSAASAVVVATGLTPVVLALHGRAIAGSSSM